MSIGEFARRSRLSPKALRLYGKLGLLAPARVDTDSGYRFYEEAQLERARLVAALRQLQVPLADIKGILGLGPEDAAERIREYWGAVEVEHTARRVLAGYLVDLMKGKRPVMAEVSTRDIPARSVLCLKRNVKGQDAAWAFGKEFVAILQRHSLPTMEGRAGAVFCIYWAELSDDSDGPLEWCRPVPESQAKALAAKVPELDLRTEPAHREAFVNIGPGGQTTPAQWSVVSESLHAWADEHTARPSGLGARITYIASTSAMTSGAPALDDLQAPPDRRRTLARAGRSRNPLRVPWPVC
jgi:DNA-binding transcriptional MerR regulator